MSDMLLGESRWFFFQQPVSASVSSLEGVPRVKRPTPGRGQGPICAYFTPCAAPGYSQTFSDRPFNEVLTAKDIDK